MGLLENVPEWGWSVVQVVCYLLGGYAAYKAGMAKGACEELRNGIHLKHAFAAGYIAGHDNGYLACLQADHGAQQLEKVEIHLRNAQRAAYKRRLEART